MRERMIRAVIGAGSGIADIIGLAFSRFWAAEDGVLPRLFGRLDRYGVPDRAMAVMAALPSVAPAVGTTMTTRLGRQMRSVGVG